MLLSKKIPVFACIALAVACFLICFSFAQTVDSATYPFGDEYIRYTFEGLTGTQNATNTGSAAPSFNGTIGGGATYSTASPKVGSTAAIFDDSGDFINTGFGASRSASTSPFSITLWAKKDSATPCSSVVKHLLGVSATPASTRFYVRCSTNKIGLRVAGNAQVNSAADMPQDTWFHVGVVMSGTVGRLYVNGVEVASSTYSGYVLPAGPIYLGNIWENGSASVAGEGWGGQIDEVAIYDRALSASEVLDSYNSVATPNAVTNVVALPFDQKVRLRWNPPTGSGVPTTTDYLIEYKLAAASTYTLFNDGISTATSTVVTGLANGSSYNFRIAPVNANGIGASSTATTTTPNTQVSLITPTPADGSTITSTSSVSVYASSTNQNATSFTLGIETSAGVPVSTVTATNRYGGYDLTNLNLVTSNLSLTSAVDDNYSGVAYAATATGASLYVIRNSRDQIKEYSLTGTLMRTITCSSCGDAESIRLISSVASTTAPGVYDHTFMVSTEDAGRIFRIVIPSTGSVTVNATDYFDTFIPHGANLGLEGIAYNSTNGHFYVNTEKSSIGLFEVTLGAGHTTSTSTICANLNWASLATDVSDLTYVNGTLYALSHESSRVIPINVASTTNCTTGTPLIFSMTQAEGITWDATGDRLFIIGEGDFFTMYRSTLYSVQGAFAGLADGSYRTYATLTDSYGNTETTPYTTFTVDFVADAPSGGGSSGGSSSDSNNSASSIVPGSLSAVSGPVLSYSELVKIFGNRAVPSANVPAQPVSPNGSAANQGMALPGGIVSSGLIIRNIAASGANSNDVKIIQRLLNSFADTRIAASGVGSAGKETNFFGPATRAAVQKFQLKFGIVKNSREQGYGVVGPKTRAKMNDLLKKQP